MQVARSEVQKDAKQLSRWEFVENSLPYFHMAIEALQNLDQGNRVVERCVSYLSQLNLLPINPCELSLCCMVPMIVDCRVLYSRPTNRGEMTKLILILPRVKLYRMIQHLLPFSKAIPTLTLLRQLAPCTPSHHQEFQIPA
jgi:hypothetical protein